MDARDQSLSSQFGARCDEARATLRRHMLVRGLREQDGWRIHEFIRQVEGRTELVMQPVHGQLTTPPDLECVCTIDEPGSNISAECRT